MSDTGSMVHATARGVMPPVAVPDDVADPSIEKASGRVELPHSIRWSGPRPVYDLAQRTDRARVYEQVLREGTADDVRRFIVVDDLLDLWDELYLPSHVRDAWCDWLRHRGIQLQC